MVGTIIWCGEVAAPCCGLLVVVMILVMMQMHSRCPLQRLLLRRGNRPQRVSLLAHADELPACANSETSRSSRVEGIGVEH